MRSAILRFALAFLLLAFVPLRNFAQNAAVNSGSHPVALSTDAVAPARFVAAHGQRALLMGYSGAGLEAWAFPFQLFRNYRIQFLPQGTANAIDGDTILRRIEYRPEEIIRTYVGPDFEVREHLFVPLDQPAVMLTYDVEGRTPVDLRLTFLPVLNLMWPGALGGQDLRWSDALSGYVISELTTGFRAVIASPQQTAHTAVVNSTLRQDLTQSMVLHPADGKAQVFAALESRTAPEGSLLHTLEQNPGALLAPAQAHVQTVLQSGLQIHTPDENLNRALAWSRLALDQAWVCNPRIGCGLVAGYGPSRGMRRPQYAWFFAGDGLIATDALLAAGDTSRARQELKFILQYQNPANGMIWHEISQSAAFVDWAHKYPYMYVHVDITFAFLSTLADYYAATGDVALLRNHWNAIDAAYRYCRTVIDPATALPQIPAGKEGGNEQDRMREDVGLSAAWVTTADAYRRLALATGHMEEAAAAAAAGAAARHALAARYWDPAKHFWIAGYSANGNAMTDERSHSGLLGHHFFAPVQEDAALDRLASADFQTDWGTRGMSARSPHFDPNSYASGSVSALGTADMALAFWRDHRPAIAWPLWESLLPWLQLDSLGHLHEVAAGDLFHPQVESVPEQTWSSAGLLDAAIHGIFGIDVDAPAHRLTLSPHLDPRWEQVSLTRIPVGLSHVSAVIDQKPGEIDATFSAAGDTAHLIFDPQIPLGATGLRAFTDGRNISVAVELHGEDQHARIELSLPQQTVHCRIVFTGGVRVLAPASDPSIGESSRQLKLTGVALRNRQLTLNADVFSGEQASVELQTPWKLASVAGGAASPLGNQWYRLTFNVDPAQPARYAHYRAIVDLEHR